MSTIKSSAENLTLNADGSGNDISIQSNAAEKLKLTAEGNLHLQGSDSRIQLNAQGGANTVGNNTVHVRGDTVNMKLMTASGGDYIYEVNGSEKMRLKSDGKLGIGTTSPAKTLDVNSGSGGNVARFTSTAAEASIQIVNDARTWSWGVRDISSNTNAAFIHDNGASADRLVISTAGVVSIPVGIELGSGVDGTAANTLDDYEEGTFTPAASGGASSTSGSYTKIGRLVTCHGTLTFPSQSNSGHVQVEGLPFTSVNADGFSGFIRYTDYNPKQIMIHGNPNATTFGLYEVDYGSSVTTVTWTEISGKRFDFTVVYFAA